MDDECALRPPRSIPVRREEIRFAKDNDEWTKDEKERTKREERSPMKALEQEKTTKAEESKGKPRKGRETADSKVTEAPKPSVRDEIDPPNTNKALSLSNYYYGPDCLIVSRDLI